jgi:hypothetical protein
MIIFARLEDYLDPSHNMDSIIEVGAGHEVSSEVLALVFTNFSKGVDVCMYISILLAIVSTYTYYPPKITHTMSSISNFFRVALRRKSGSRDLKVIFLHNN